jgi:hypothetical protein
VPFTAEEKRGVTRACIAVLCHILADIKVGLPAAGAAIGEVAEIEHPGEDTSKGAFKFDTRRAADSGMSQIFDTCISF